MPLDRGTNEYYGDEDEKDDYEPDIDKENDDKWLEEHDCCRGDCK